MEGFIIEVKINKEIQRYQESILFGLSLRQMVFALLAIGVAVGAYFGLKPLIGAAEVGWVCMLAAFPFAMCGFFTYNGMPAERFLLAVIRSEILCPRTLSYAVVALLFLSRQLISRYNYLEISAEELKPGMIPAAASVALMLPSGMADLPSRLSEDLSCRLTEKQIAAIRKWFSKQKDVKEITIVRKIPFAIFITLGYFLFALMGILR